MVLVPVFKKKGEFFQLGLSRRFYPASAVARLQERYGADDVVIKKRGQDFLLMLRSGNDRQLLEVLNELLYLSRNVKKD